MESIVTNIAQSGRVLIPASFRKSLDLNIGDELIMRIDNGEIKLTPRAEGVRRAQAIVAQYVNPSESMVDELITERREEAKRELEQ